MVVKRAKTRLSPNAWALVAVVVSLGMVPNGTAVKLLSHNLEPASIALIRYGIVAIILMTVFFVMLKKHQKAVRKNIGKIILTAIPFSLGGPLYISAVAESNASYVAVLLLLTPIIFGVLSMFFTKDKITKSSIMGILLALLGGVVVILVPALQDSSAGFFGLIPLIMMGLYILLHAAFPVVVRRENESGVPLVMVFAIQYLFGAIAALIWASLTVGSGIFTEIAEMNLTDWLLIAYLAIGFSVILREISIRAYEKAGTSTTVAVNYLGQVLSVIFPVLVIGETLSWEMALGAALIMIGIILTRRHHKGHNHMVVHR